MFTNVEVERYMAHLKDKIPYNAHFENIDVFGNAVDMIKAAVLFEKHEDIESVMLAASMEALNHIGSFRQDKGYAAKGRGGKSVIITDLDWASLCNYMPLRLSRFLEGFQAEAQVRRYLEEMKNIKVLADKDLDLYVHMKYHTDSKDFSADINHHIDVAIEHKKKVYLIHIFKESSKERLKKKIANYMSKKNNSKILEGRHGITFTGLSALTKESVTKQVYQIFDGDRQIKIKLDGTVQFVDFD